jgi:opacity protein-like surface antigen
MQHHDSTVQRGSDRNSLRKSCAAVAVLLTFLWAGSASAGELYLSGGIGISGGTADTGGSTPFFENSGSDTDSAAMYGFSFGFEMPMNEPLPEQWQHLIPNWPVLAEFEAVGGRDYEFLTDGGDPYRTDFEAWTVLHNIRLDIPVAAPFERAFGRIPILHPVTLYVGAGIGISIYEVETTDNVSSGSDDSIAFAWQAGAGLSYSISEYISLDLGYRYVDLGTSEFDLSVGPNDFGNFSLDTAAHELATAVRVRFYGVPLHDRYR